MGEEFYAQVKAFLGQLMLSPEQQSSVHEAFQMGARTVAQQMGLEDDSVVFDGQSYKLLAGPIDFTKRGPRFIASLGKGDREAILLDRQSSRMQGLYREFKTTYDTSLSDKDLHAQLIKFCREKLPSTDIDYEHRTIYPIIEGGRERSLPVVPMEKVVNEGKGVCRHHGLLACFLMGELLREKSVKGISVHHCRANLKRHGATGAHTWMVVKQGERLFLVDTLWDKNLELTNFKDYQIACKYYTSKAINDILTERAGLEIPKDTTSHEDKALAEELDKLSDASITTIIDLIDKGANVNTQGQSSGWSVAHVAADTDNIRLMEFLLNTNAVFDLQSSSRGQTPLHYVKSKEMLTLFANAGADISIKNKKGQSAIDANPTLFEDYAKDLVANKEFSHPWLEQILPKSNREAIKELALMNDYVLEQLTRLGKLDEQSKYQTFERLKGEITRAIDMLCSTEPKSIDVAALQRLVDDATNIKPKPKDNRSEADKALARELDNTNNANITTIIELIANGANVNTQGNDTGWSAAHVAAFTNSLDLMNLVVEKEAMLDLRSSARGQTPLHYVNSKEMLKLFADAGADISIKNKEGQSAIKAKPTLFEDYAKDLVANKEFSHPWLEQILPNSNRDAIEDLVRLNDYVSEQLRRLGKPDKKFKYQTFERLQGEINSAIDTLCSTESKTIDVAALQKRVDETSQIKRNPKLDKALSFFKRKTPKSKQQFEEYKEPKP